MRALKSSQHVLLELPAAAEPAKASWGQGLQTLVLTAGAQSGIQLLAVITGLLVVRLLPVREYAYYTIANAALGSLTVLTDCGVTQSVLALGGRVWQSPASLGAIAAGGMRLRHRFALIALVIAVPFVFTQLRQQGAGVSAALLVTASMLPLLLSSITNQVLEVMPRLHQRLAQLQRIQLTGAALRLLSTVAFVAVFPLAWLATLGAALGQIWATWRVARLAGTFANLHAPPEPGISREMARLVTRAAPNAIYYALSGQITVWLIAFLGTTAAVAQVGALGRLAMIYNVVTAAFTVVVVPRFARARFTVEGAALSVYWQTQLAVLVPLSLIVLAVAAFPTAALMLLGHQYSGLTAEVVLAAVGGAVGTLAGIAYALAAARGVITAPWLVVPAAVLAQTGLILSLPLRTVSGVLWLGIFSNLVLWAIYALYFTWALLRRGTASQASQDRR